MSCICGVGCTVCIANHVFVLVIVAVRVRKQCLHRQVCGALGCHTLNAKYYGQAELSVYIVHVQYLKSSILTLGVHAQRAARVTVVCWPTGIILGSVTIIM